MSCTNPGSLTVHRTQHMISSHRQFLGFLAVLVGILSVSPAVATGQEQASVANIKRFPEQYFNRQVRIRGQATEVVVARSGLSQGTYRLLDDTDPTGILVRTGAELPTPGKIYVVTGDVAQLADNANAIGLMERKRATDDPRWGLLALIAASGLAAVVLAVLLFRALREPAGTAAIPQPAPQPMPNPMPFPAPPPIPQPIPQPPPHRPGPTAVVNHTEPFEVSGASVRVVSGPNRDTEMPIGVEEFLIGRDGARNNHLKINDSTVSQAHARIRWDKTNGRFFLVNDSLTNKARLNGAPVEMAELQNGSRIQLGSVTLEFRRDPASGNGGTP